MFVNLFKKNDPYKIIWICLFLITVRLIQSHFLILPSYLELKWLLLGNWLSQGYLLYSETYDYTAPLTAIIYRIIDSTFGQSLLVHIVFSTLLIIVQSLIFNTMLMKIKTYSSQSMIPAFLFAMLMSSIPDFMALSPQLISHTFILLGLQNVFVRINNQTNDNLFLFSGIYMGLATITYMPSIVFFILFGLSKILFSNSTSRRMLIYFIGFAIVLSACGIYFMLSNRLSLFISYALWHSLIPDSSMMLKKEWMIFLCFGILFFFSFLKVSTVVKLTNFQQKIFYVQILLLVGAIISFFLSKENNQLELIFVVPPIAYLLTYYLATFRNRKTQWIISFLSVLGPFFFSIYLYQNVVESRVVKKDDTIQEKNVMVLGSHLERYASTKAGTPCFDKVITRIAIDETQYYEGATFFYDMMIKRNPKTIIDEWGILPAVLEKFPTLNEKYHQKNEKEFIRLSD